VWDRLQPAESGSRLLAASQALPANASPDQWVCHRLEPLLDPGACDVEAHQTIHVGQVEGRFKGIPEGFAAAAVTRGRGYVFLLLPATVDRSQFLLFDAFLGTVRLEPDKARD
jgi:hypothetical protein